MSPDGKYVLAVVSETATGTKNSIVPNWITDSSFPEDLPGRTRVGDTTGVTRHLAVINAVTGEVKMVDHGEVTGATAAQIEDGGCGGFGGGGGGGFGQAVAFSPDGTKAMFSARSQDSKTCWLFSLDPATAKAKIVNTDHDAAWIGGPGQRTGLAGR